MLKEAGMTTTKQEYQVLFNQLYGNEINLKTLGLAVKIDQVRQQKIAELAELTNSQTVKKIQAMKPGETIEIEKVREVARKNFWKKAILAAVFVIGVILLQLQSQAFSWEFRLLS